MSGMRLRYFESEDILHLVLSEEPEWGSVEITPNVTVELNEQGEVIGLRFWKPVVFSETPC
jgi:uncharacterized protein YuzE